jgi:hypothetical protein
VTSFEYVSAPRAVTVLPSRVGRRLTRRDGVLPLVLALELVAGVAFGLAAASGGSSATGVPERMTLGSGPIVTVLPSMRPVAHVVSGTAGDRAALAGPTAGPVAPAAAPPAIGPAVGPLRPGTVRAALAKPVVLAAPTFAEPTVVAPTPYPKHAPRNPFAALVRSAG